MSLSRYRAWDKENSRMVYPSTDDVYFVLTDDGINILDMSVEPFDDVFPRLDAVLMQSTGLKDKNGVEIYVGDIAETRQGDLSNTPFEMVGGVVAYDSDYGMFKLVRKYGSKFHPFTIWLTNVEVIGNVWEDGDLLDDNKETECNRAY